MNGALLFDGMVGMDWCADGIRHSRPPMGSPLNSALGPRFIRVHVRRTTLARNEFAPAAAHRRGIHQVRNRVRSGRPARATVRWRTENGRRGDRS